MSSGGTDKLVDQFGRQLIPEPRLIVVKYSKNVKIDPRVIQILQKTHGAVVITMPMDSEVLTGNAAMGELKKQKLIIDTAIEKASSTEVN